MEREAVERVARRLALADGFHPDAASNDDDSQEAWTLYVGQARAAIAEVMAISSEPTPAMLEAGEHALARSLYGLGYILPETAMGEILRGSLSASPLSEGGQTNQPVKSGDNGDG